MDRKIINSNSTVQQTNLFTILQPQVQIGFLLWDEVDSSNIITYNTAESPFGTLLIASVERGICSIDFLSANDNPVKTLKNRFSNAVLQQGENSLFDRIAMVWNKEQSVTIPICVKGTPFQIAVWQIVLTVLPGETITYNGIAQQLNKTKAARAVGTAVGKNPLAYIIPCHRVVGQHGAMGGYRWGIERKKALLQWERRSNLTLNSEKM